MDKQTNLLAKTETTNPFYLGRVNQGNNMPLYAVDIGSWEKGRTERIYALTPLQAYQDANQLIKAYIASGHLPSDSEVVEIFELRNNKRTKCCYDYMNGFELYEKRRNNE